MLTNGSLIDRDMAQRLQDSGVCYVQLSLDGVRETHDALRAPGNFDRTLQAARMLKDRHIPVHISFTANRQNLHQLPELARICRSIGVDKLWTDRIVPIGRGSEMADLAIRREDMPAYLDAIRRARGGMLAQLLHPETEVSAARALQFQCGGDCYVCGAGIDLVTVDEHGHIFPCRRMPIDCGSIRETTLVQVWQSHPVFIDLKRRQIPRACLACASCYVCRGGARCQAYAKTGSYLTPDPACDRCAE